MKLIVVGILCGMLTGLGMGGGSFLIVFLTSFLYMEQHISQATNLIFYIPTSIAALLVYFKNKKIDSAIGRKLLFPTILGTLLGAFLAKKMSSSGLKKLFAIFVLLVGIKELIYSINMFIKKKGSKKSI